MAKDETAAADRCSLSIRTDPKTRDSLAKIGRAIDRDVTYVHRGLLDYGIDKFLKKPQDLATFLLRQRNSKKKA